MNPDKDLSPNPDFTANRESAAATDSTEHLDRIVAQIQEIADRDRTDPLALLQLLRTLEQIHREIQQGYFQAALPNSRQSLFALLRDIEENGGWPYIQRWKLQQLLANLPESEQVRADWQNLDRYHE
jgi:ABC-type transporter Mla subunit MlaD